MWLPWKPVRGVGAACGARKAPGLTRGLQLGAAGWVSLLSLPTPWTAATLLWKAVQEACLHFSLGLQPGYLNFNQRQLESLGEQPAWDWARMPMQGASRSETGEPRVSPRARGWLQPLSEPRKA